MKYELTSDDKKRIDAAERTDAIIKFNKAKDSFRFNIGDVLIKQHWRGRDESWNTETIGSSTDAPAKFVYVYEDNHGIGYVKQILSNGKLRGAITPMTNFDPESVRFQLDPDYADHIMLADEGEEFKPNVIHEMKRKYREQAYRSNKKLLIPVSTYLERQLFLGDLRIGDKFWMGGNMDNMVETTFEVTNTETMDVAAIDDGYNRRRWIEAINKYPELSGVKYIGVTIKVLSTPAGRYAYYKVGQTRTLTMIDFGEKFVCKQQPRKMKEEGT
jgi:hypothetical protein